MKKIFVIALMFFMCGFGAFAADVADLPRAEVDRRIESFRVTQNWSSADNSKSLVFQVVIVQGDIKSNYVFMLEGSEYDAFYRGWTSCDDIFNIIYERLGINAKVAVNAGESVCYNGNNAQ